MPKTHKITCMECEKAASMVITTAAPSLDDDQASKTVVLCPAHAVRWMVECLEGVANIALPGEV